MTVEEINAILEWVAEQRHYAGELPKAHTKALDHLTALAVALLEERDRQTAAKLEPPPKLGQQLETLKQAFRFAAQTHLRPCGAPYTPGCTCGSDLAWDAAWDIFGGPR